LVHEEAAMLAALLGKNDMSDVVRLAVFGAAFGVVVLLSQLIKAVASFLRINRAMQVCCRLCDVCCSTHHAFSTT
jgi:hypothetical protein